MKELLQRIKDKKTKLEGYYPLDPALVKNL